MSIKIIQGDIFTSTTDAIVNPVNCVGVMGRGLASEFKRRFPGYFNDYVKLCMSKRLYLGKVKLYETNEQYPRWIVSFPTKYHWKEDSTLSGIFLGLESLARNIDRYGIGSIAIPMLGCGNGRLKWDDVKPMIIKVLSPLEHVSIEIYELHGRY